MLRRSPRAVLLWAAAAIVAVATAAYVADILVSLRHQDQAFGPVHTVVVATRDLPLGRRLHARDLTDRRVRGEAQEPRRARRADGPRSAGWSRCPLLRGAVVTDRHLAAHRRNGRDGTVPAGRRAMRVVDRWRRPPAARRSGRPVRDVRSPDGRCGRRADVDDRARCPRHRGRPRGPVGLGRRRRRDRRHRPRHPGRGEATRLRHRRRHPRARHRPTGGHCRPAEPTPDTLPA